MNNTQDKFNGFTLMIDDERLCIRKFGKEPQEETFEKLAIAFSEGLKHEHPQITDFFIHLMGMISFIAVENSAAYNGFKGILKEIKQMRNDKIEHELGINLKTLTKNESNDTQTDTGRTE